MFTKVYKETTDPNVSYKRLLSTDVFLSIIFHTIAYTLILCIIVYVFRIKLKPETYVRFISVLVIVMAIGYPLRLARVKSLVKNDFSPDIIHNGYFRWYYLS